MSAPVVHALHPDPLVTLFTVLYDVLSVIHAGILRLPLWTHLLLVVAFVFFLLSAVFGGPPRSVKRE